MSDDLVTIKIDGRETRVPAGTRVVEAARQLGIDIPIFCYHPRLSMEEGGANCRMCLVEVATPRRNPDGTTVMARMPKPQTACSLPVSEGMEVYTDTEQLRADRRGVLEFLLINHPLDCPICDRGGECPLQNNTLHYGPPVSRYIEEKRHFPKAYPLSEHVVFDRERCIHCARCTRFTRDVSGDSQLDFLYRGADMEVSTFAHTEFTSRFSGNTIEICPVGALLSRQYRFKARPWDLLTQKSICTRCANGCNIKLDYRVSKLVRVNARLNEAVNEEWTCDRGKFGMGYVSADDRLLVPMVRRSGNLEPATWEEANDRVVAALQEAGGSVGGIGGASTPNEDLYIWQRFFREFLGSPHLDHRMGPNFPPARSALFKRFGHHTMGSSIAGLERMKAILVFGSNLVDEQPILFLRVRKAWRFGKARVVQVIPADLDTADAPNHVSEFADVTLRYVPGAEAAAARALVEALDAEPGSEGAARLDAAAREAGLQADAVRRAAGLLRAEAAAVLAGALVTDHVRTDEVVAALGDLAERIGASGGVNLPVTVCNQQGAMDMGILPDSGPGYAPVETAGMNAQQMLAAAEEGRLKALWIVNEDVVSRFHDPDLARRALAACPFVVVNALTLDETARLADVVLPVQSVAERDGTFTNVERRVQRFIRAFELAPSVHPDWLVFSQVAAQMGHAMPYFSAREILAEIAANVGIYAGCGPRNLVGEGVRWEYASEAAS